MRLADEIRFARPRVVTVTPWIVVVLGLVASLASTGSSAPDPLLSIACQTLLAGALVVGVLVTMAREPRRRSTLLVLLVGFLAWMTGAVTLAASGAQGPVPFPAPGEVLFLLGYAAIAVFVFLDARGSGAGRSVTAWGDAVILVGGTAALGALLVLGPLAGLRPDSDVDLVVALVYPLLSLALAALVLGQAALGMRPWGRRTAGLMSAFALLSVADLSLYSAWGGGAYAFAVAVVVVWAVGLILLVQSACAVRPPMPASGTRRVSPVLLVGGFIASVLLLIVRPQGPVGAVIAVAAGAVLVAAAIRVGLALSSAPARRPGAEGIDSPTGLASRDALTDRLARDLAAGRRVGVLALDVAGLGEATTAFGPGAADDLLRSVAGAIGDRIPEGAVAARVADVVIVAMRTDDEIVLREVGAALRSAMPASVEVDGVRVSARLRVGIAVSRGGSHRPDDLIAAALAALAEARTSAAGVAVAGGGTTPRPRHRLQMASELRDALRNGGLDVWYQPVIVAATGAVERWEALVRWNHPREGTVPPGLFLPLARREGLMHEVSLQVAARVAADLAEWRRSGLEAAASINLAPPELHGGALVPAILDAWADQGLDPQSLTIEITEDAFLQAPEAARMMLEEIRRAGPALSIDHYGSGFSSLAYLRELPLSEVKIDRSFFAAVCTDPRSAVIVQSTVAMAHALGVSVVAEGIESQEVAARAIVLGVDRLQGYAFSVALTAAAVPMFALQRELRVPGAE